MKLETKDLLTVDEISSKEFLELIDFSIKLKKESKMGKGKPLLENKSLTNLNLSGNNICNENDDGLNSLLTGVSKHEKLVILNSHSNIF